MWSIYLDFGGGLLSIFQLVFDSIDLGDLMGGIMGNWAKLALGVLTLCLDVRIMKLFCMRAWLIWTVTPSAKLVIILTLSSQFSVAMC